MSLDLGNTVASSLILLAFTKPKLLARCIMWSSPPPPTLLPFTFLLLLKLLHLWEHLSPRLSEEVRQPHPECSYISGRDASCKQLHCRRRQDPPPETSQLDRDREVFLILSTLALGSPQLNSATWLSARLPLFWPFLDCLSIEQTNYQKTSA